MLAIEKIAPGVSMTGIEPAVVVTVVAVVPIAEGTVQLFNESCQIRSAFHNARTRNV